MVVFKSPFSRRTHSVPIYDMDDYILNNSRTKERKDQNVFNNEVMTKRNPLLVKFQTKKDVYRDRTLGKEYILRSAERERKRFYARKYYNY